MGGLRWEDCTNKDFRKAEEDDKWREKADVREKWKGIAAGLVQWYSNQHLLLIKGSTRKNNTTRGE